MTQAPGVVRPNKCGNCGGEHATRDCSKPLLEANQRACFNCGGLGHLSRDCLDKKQAPARRPPSRPARGRPANSVEEEDNVVHALMVTVDADGYQGVCQLNSAPATLSNSHAQRAGLSQRERKAGPRLQNMSDLLGGGDSVSADISYTIGIACNSMRYTSAGDSSSSSASSSSTSRPSGRPASTNTLNIIISITYWPERCSTSHGGMVDVVFRRIRWLE